MTTPKERFQVSGNMTEFKKLVANTSFEPACDYAILQLQSEMPTCVQPGIPPDPLLGMDANAQMIGAQRVLEILKHLHEPVKPVQSPVTAKLHY